VPELNDPKSVSAQLDQRAQDVIDQSREAIKATKLALEQSRDLLERLKQAANRPLILPLQNNALPELPVPDHRPEAPVLGLRRPGDRDPSELAGRQGRVEARRRGEAGPINHSGCLTGKRNTR
jgi:hypothetical protein